MHEQPEITESTVFDGRTANLRIRNKVKQTVQNKKS